MKGQDLIYFLETRGLKLTHIEFRDEELEFCFSVWAKAGSKKEKLSISSEGELIIATKAKAVEGKANESIQTVIARGLGISTAQVELISGHKSKHKRFKINYFFTDRKDVDYYKGKMVKALSI